MRSHWTEKMKNKGIFCKIFGKSPEVKNEDNL